MNSMMLEECCMRSCEDSYDIDINPDDTSTTKGKSSISM